MNRSRKWQSVIAGLTMALAAHVQAQVLLNDPLQGSTIGTRSGGTFVTGGWKITNGHEYIYWHLPHNVTWGAVEFYVSGLISRDPAMPGDSDLMEMYDFNFGGDTVYSPGYRDNPYKFRLQKHGTVYDYIGLADACQVTWIFPPDDLEYEWDTSVLSWNPATNYKCRLEWGPPSGGYSPCKFLRNDVLIWQRTLLGNYTPPGHAVRLGWSLRDVDNAPLNAIFSNLTVYELSGNPTPGSPTIVKPSLSATVNTVTPKIVWTGDAHTSYQVRINSSNDPSTGIVYDSGTVSSTANEAITGTLSNNTTYYVFVRLQNANGLGSWSATGQWFHVDTSFSHPHYGLVRLNGYSLYDDGGPFLGLGASYFAGMWFCKYDRVRYRSDLALLAQGGFTHIRVLSEITGGCGGWWDGKDTSPFPYTSDGGCPMPAWPDYDQQFRDAVDIAFDEYGIRTEVVIFGGFNVNNVPGGETTLNNHVGRILSLIQGREQKIAFIEVGNESWQTGFGYPGGLALMKSMCATIAAATPVLVAITSPGADFTYQGVYQGTSADLATQHLARDQIDNRWYDVTDAWRLYVEWPAAPPTSSDEPIGPGSSVNEENEPIKLVSAAMFAWAAKLPIYCWHSIAGIRHWDDAHSFKFFENMAGVGDYAHLAQILPPDLPAWTRNDGKESAAPFTVFCAGQPNKYWNEVPGATDGCYWNIGGKQGNQFVCIPVGILSGGLTLQARQNISFIVYNPLTGGVVTSMTLTAGQTFSLPQGPQAYIIQSPDIGVGTGTQVSIDLGTTDIPVGLTHPQVGDGNTSAITIGGRDCRKNVTPTTDHYFYFAVADTYMYQGNKPTQTIRVDYYDTGTSTLTLQYDGTSSAYVNGPNVVLTNTNTWKTVVWNISDAYFGNRQNSGADFRIANSTNTNFYLDKLAVYQRAFTGTPVALPGTVQAENFDNGGEGYGYHDADVGNNGGQYRPNENVDIEVTSDGGNGYNVGWTAATEYMNYQVNVTSAGVYDISVRLATPNTGGTYHIDMNGVNVTGTRTVPNTGGWQTWTTSVIPNITLSAGVQTMKFTVDIAGYNLNYIALEKHQSPFGGSARAIPGVIQGEDFDDGGADTAYHDFDVPNNDAEYRTSEQVDIEVCTDTGGGYDVGWTDNGDWLEYTVNVNTTGDYAVKVRAASGGCCGGSFHMSLDGSNIFSTRSFDYTGGWQNWTTIIVPGIYMSAGTNKILRLSVDGGGWNFNHFDFTFGGADVVSEDLDATNIDDGMTHPQVGDGVTDYATIGGHNCRKNLDPAFDYYMYFTIADIYAFQGNKNNAAITVEYYDTGTGALELHYDGASNPYTYGGAVVRTNTNTWKTFTFNVTDAYFGNRQNNGADFRIYGAATTFYIDTVMVFSSTGVSPPGQATNPSPANGATLVPVTSSLTWTAGSGATSHDVRFGTANPPPFIQNQAGTSYTPPTTTPNTVYYWRIDEKNTAGTTTGVVWSFTTLPLPGAASSPSPASGATLVPITSTLSWTAGSNTASHDVRFGTVNPPPFIQNQTGTSYTPATMSPNTVYYWRIDEKNSSGTTTGTVWSFTTLPVPGAASAPNPANAATGVSITTSLSWTAGSNATSHDVRFGTANPPPFVVNQTATTYSPGTLSSNTTYFWRIDEKNTSGTTNGAVWSFTTLPLPGAASAPNPANAATGVSITATLSWTAGSNATSHDLRFGTANPPPFIVNQAGTTYNPGTLASNTTYFWRIDEKNGSGTTTGTVWSFTTVSAGPATENVKVAGLITVNGNSSDWNLSQFVTKVRGGEHVTGDYAIVGFDGTTLYYGGYWTGGVLPTSGTDHTATMYSLHDSTYLYFLVRVNDSNLQTPYAVGTNWANDCVEFYIDPGNDGGSTTMNNSTSDIQLVIDALNQKNVYVCTSGYTTQVLSGVTSAVTTDASGWWLEVRIAKTALSPAIPASGQFGLDYNFRDNDNNNDPTLTTVYTWSDPSSGAGFPSKIPNNWGKASLAALPAAPGAATNPSPASGATGVSTTPTLTWTAGTGSPLSHDVRFGTTNPPPFVQNQTGSSYAPSTLANSTTYYWRIDEKNAGGTTTGTVWSFTTAAGGPVTLNNSAFPSNTDGWNVVLWHSGFYADGGMAWSNVNGNPSGNMFTYGSGATNNTDSCNREGGEINKAVSTAGYNTLVQVVYDLRFVTDQTGPTCIGPCTANVLEGDCADKIAVYYSTAGTGGPWTLLETVNASSLTQSVWYTRTINCPAAANNKPNFAVRFRSQFNSDSDSARFDNIKVIATP